MLGKSDRRTVRGQTIEPQGPRAAEQQTEDSLDAGVVADPVRGDLLDSRMHGRDQAVVCSADTQRAEPRPGQFHGCGDDAVQRRVQIEIGGDARRSPAGESPADPGRPAPRHVGRRSRIPMSADLTQTTPCPPDRCRARALTPLVPEIVVVERVQHRRPGMTKGA